MAYEFELKYPLADPENVSAEDLIEAAAQRTNLAEVFTATESAVYEPEIKRLTSDAYLILRAAQAISRGEEVRDAGEEAEDLGQAIEHAEMLRAAIGIGDDRADEITPGALYQLSRGLESLLRRLKALDLDAVETDRECALECDCPKCISFDDDMNMLSDNLYTAAGEESIRGLRLASFKHNEEFGALLRGFVASHAPMQEGGN